MCTINGVTFRAPLCILWLCVCRLSYAACNAHALYYIVVCGMSGSTIYFHIISYLRWTQILIFDILCNACWKTSHSKKNSARCCHRCIQVFKYCPLCSRQILMKHEFPRKLFEKYSNTKFHENPPLGTELYHADRRTDMTKLIVVCRNSAKLPKTAAEEKIA